MNDKYLIEIIGDASQADRAFSQVVDSAKAASQKTADFFAQSTAKMESQYNQYIRQRIQMDQMYADMFDQLESKRLAATEATTRARQQQAEQTYRMYDQEITAAARLNAELQRTYDLTGKLNSSKFIDTSVGVRQGVREGRTYLASMNDEDDLFTAPIQLDQALAQRNAILQRRNEEAARDASNFRKNIAQMITNAGVDPGIMTYDEAISNKRYIESRFGGAQGFLSFSDQKGNLESAKQLLTTMDAVGVSVDKNKTLFDEFASKFKAHALMLPAYLLTWQAVQEAIDGVRYAFDETIRAQKEQVLQSFYYQAAGIKGFSPQEALTGTGQSGQNFAASIALAREYGADVMQVQEQMGLWVKQTHDVNAALYMTNESLKMHMVSGMGLEDIYRSTIGVLSQYHQSLASTEKLFDVGTGLALKYAGGLQMLGGEGEDAAGQMIRGMDAASAVMAKFGLSFEQAGALVAVQLQTLAKEGGGSGYSVGENIASALAALEKGAAYNALDEVGIKIEHNSKLIDQLAESWNKITKNGKTLGDVLGQVVRPGQFETLENIVHQVKLFDQALKEAKQAESGHITDQLATQMFGTLDVQLAQFKAGIQAIAMSIGKEFMGPLSGTVAFLNDKFVPSVLSNIGALKTFGEEFLQIIGIMLGIKAVNFIPTLFLGIRTAAIEAATVLGTAWSEAANVVSMANGKMVATNAALGTSMEGAALASEASAMRIGTAFMKVIPVLGQVLIAADLVRMGVQFALDKASQAYVNYNMDPHNRARTESDLMHRMALEERIKAAGGNLAKAGIAPGSPDADLAMGMVGNAGDLYAQDWQKYQALKTGMFNPETARERAAHDDRLKMQQDLYEAMLKGKQAAAGIFPSPPGGPTDESGNPASGKGPKGMAKDYADFGVQMNAWVAVANMAVEKYKGLAAAADVHIASLEREIKLYPGQISLLSDLSDANNTRNKYLGLENQAIQTKLHFDQQEINAATAHINSSKAMSQEQVGWIEKKTQAIQKLNEDTAAINANNDAMKNNIDLLAQNAQSYLTEMDKRLTADDKKFTDAKTGKGKQHALSQYTSDYQSTTAQFFNWLYQQPVEVINALLPMYKEWQQTHLETIAANNQATQDFISNLQDAADKLQDSLGDKTMTALDSMSDGKEYDKTYVKSMASFYKERDDYERQYADMVDKANDPTDKHLQQLRESLNAWETIVPLAAQYTLELQKAEDSGLLTGLMAAVKDLSSGISSGIIDSMFGVNGINRAIQNLEEENNLLNDQNTIVDDAYNLHKTHSIDQIAQHDYYLRQLKKEQEQIKANEKAEQDRLAHPPLLKKMAMDFTKQMVDSFLQQLEDQAKKSILSKIFGLGNDNPMMQAAKKLADIISNDTTGSMYNNVQQLQRIFIDDPHSFYNAVQSITMGGGGSDFQAPTFSGGGFGVGVGGSVLSSLASGGGIVGALAAGFGSALSRGFNSYYSPSGGSGGSGNFQPPTFFPDGGFGVGVGLGPLSKKPSFLQGAYGTIMAGLGGYETAQQGGLMNSVMGGLQGGLGTLAATGNPWLAAGVGFVDFISGMIGGDKNPAHKPDIFDTQNWGQTLANLVGNGQVPGLNPTWIANGQGFTEDPSLAQSLGGQGELMFISNWIAQNPKEAQKLLGPALISDFSGLQNVTANGGPIADGKNGNLTLSNGVTMNWQSLAQAANEATQAILQFKDQLGQAQAPLVGFNQFGAGVGFFPYSWQVPGYDIYSNQNNPNSPVSNNPPGGTPPTAPGGNPGRNPRNPGGGGGGPKGGGDVNELSYMASVPVINVYVQSPDVNLDGRSIARNNQAYVLRARLQGYQNIS